MKTMQTYEKIKDVITSPLIQSFGSQLYFEIKLGDLANSLQLNMKSRA